MKNNTFFNKRILFILIGFLGLFGLFYKNSDLSVYKIYHVSITDPAFTVANLKGFFETPADWVVNPGKNEGLTKKQFKDRVKCIEKMTSLECFVLSENISSEDLFFLFNSKSQYVEVTSKGQTYNYLYFSALGLFISVAGLLIFASTILSEGLRFEGSPFRILLNRIIDVSVNFINRLSGRGMGGANYDNQISCLQSLGLNSDAKGITVIDVGANRGQWIDALAVKMEISQCLLIEPVSKLALQLKEKYALCDNFIVRQLAVDSGEEGQRYYFEYLAGDTFSSLLERKNLEVAKKYLVKTRTLYSLWANELRKSSIDVLKIDVEGYERDVIESLGTEISKCRYIQFEFSINNMNRGHLFFDFFSWFTTRGWEIYRVSSFGPIPIKRYTDLDEWSRATDYIGVNRNSPQAARPESDVSV